MVRPRAGEEPSEDRVRLLRELASDGRLALAARDGAQRAVLTAAAYDLVWPIVFARLTRRLEQQRGHLACASGIGALADECLDRFHDDVEAVVEDLLAHARQPIDRLEAWVATRVGAATVNAHRRRRGSRGALQRPRLPGWLAAALDDDPWLTTLATHILVWVGVSGTAGSGTWPLESWAQERATRTGDWQGTDPAAVGRDVERVLSAMRRRPTWYESFVERPLGAKQPPVAAVCTDEYGEPLAPLTLGDPDQRVDAELHLLAGDAVRAIRHRLGSGEQAEAAVAEVIRTVFGGLFTSTLDRAPHTGGDPVGEVAASRLGHIVATVLAIVGETE
ncbi:MULTISPECIES: hypothetical protein [Actinoplanes]|uniref:hypothetical protein n=1 Tax=Actinoplanes TaxID=1865 RepID=UPI0006986E2F|nr:MULTISPECIES: hypothetical protein [Actinoplanes]GLY06945.1 hypothetical protein Acsp01_73240 [Actinoplanes sp. NBRC 101535]